MKRKKTPVVLTAVAILASGVAGAATIGPSLGARITGLSDSADAGIVIVAFDTTGGLGGSNVALLQSKGITRGITLDQLGMVAVPATAGQVRALAGDASVLSVWSNDRLHYYMHQARVLTGVGKSEIDSGFTGANRGLPFSGAGDFSVVINDSGIDGTHADLEYPQHVIQNVQIVTDTATLSPTAPEGFTPLLAVENVPDTDTHVGHGTHCAGIVAGTGQDSGGLYRGVAPGARLIGLGSGAGLFILNGLGGFEWSLANQAAYRIRVISNSWGGGGAFDPNDPIALASKRAHDRNIVVVFAAGNSGPSQDTMSPYAKAPWVIGVAAGTKEGGLVGFSSRGIPAGQRPPGDFNYPTITAPGTGREFDSDSAIFTSDVVSTRALTNVVANGATADTEIPTGYLPFYTQISGTSMATPHIAGVVALLLQANPSLTADQVKTTLQQTASRMPGFEDFEVGSGYVNAYAAIDKVLHPSKNYGTFVAPPFNQQITTTWSPNVENFSILFVPQVPGPTSLNTYHFTVAPGLGILDVSIDFGQSAATDETGNSMGLVLYPPGCLDLSCGYSSGLTLPILDTPKREVTVRFPAAGQWTAEIRGLRGLTVADQCVCSPAGIAVPETVTGSVKRATVTLSVPRDIVGNPAEAEIRSSLLNRQMDSFPDGTFRPNSNVTRIDFARSLSFNTSLRQTLAAAPRFTDVSAALEPTAEAVTSPGATLRDWNFSAPGLMSAAGTKFSPTGLIARMDLAVALVRALGLDAAAQALAGSDVTATYSGQTVVVADNAQIPADKRGYLQIALDKQILQAFFSFQQGPNDFQPTLVAQVRPAGSVTRAFLAFAYDHFRQAFVAGN